MGTNRLEAFSDGVIAIIITVMVLEMKIPHGAGIDALLPVVPVFLSYVLSFLYLGIYWNNHHHMLHATKRTSGGILWANLHLLFWLSLVPFATWWLGQSRFAPVPSAVYGVALLMPAVRQYGYGQRSVGRQGQVRAGCDRCNRSERHRQSASGVCCQRGRAQRGINGKDRIARDHCGE